MINKYKDNYYEVLRLSQDKWHENMNNYEPFMLFFLQILYKCYEEINDRVIKICKNSFTKTDKIKELVLSSIIPISKKEIFDYFSDISITTIEKVLSDMLKEKIIIKIGTYKDARYYKADKDNS